MAADEKWYFTKEQLGNTPSRRCGIDADKELSYRQQAANFIQDMGQRLQVSQLCINTAIVYMHRFYVFHSLSQFHRNAIASAALFLAAKVEEQPRKLEHVIKISHTCLHRDQTPIDTRSEHYLEQAQDLVFNENVLLQTLGFDVAIDHPHTHVVRCCHLVKASKDLAQTSYFMASNSLHLTTMCLQYKPTVVACFCIHLACKWSNWEIPQSNEGKHWFWYVDSTVTAEQLQQLTAEFLHIFDKCPSRLKRKIMSISANQSPSINHPSLPNSPFDAEPRRVQSPAMDGGPTFQSSRPFPPEDPKKPVGSGAASTNRLPMDYREYREKKERERIEREKTVVGGPAPNQSAQGGAEIPAKPHHSHSHHAKQQQPSSQSSATSGKHPTVQGSKPMHHNHHSAHRNDGKPGGPQPSQRHSSSASSSTGQSGRPRNPREYGVPVPVTTANPQTIYNHQPKDSLLTGSEGISDISTNISGDIGIPGSRDSRDVEKLTNHSRGDVKHEKPGQQMQQRGYDPRGKIPEHRSKEEAKAYAKYQEQQQQQQQQRGRKVVDSVEQRSEEVRKLIEKPIAIPKSSMRAEVVLQREDYIANMLKPSHKLQTTSGQPPAGPAVSSNANLPRNPPEYGLQPVNQREKGLSKSSLQQQQQQVKYEKNDVKNGNSQGNNQEDVRSRMQSQQQAPSVPSQPVKQHKSLFSPEKVSNPRESHSSRVSRQTRQKTSPTAGNISSLSVGNTGITSISKSAKMQERVPDPMGGGLDLCSFGSPHGVSMSHGASQLSQHHQESKQSSHSKRHRTSSMGDSAKPMKIEIKAESEDNRDNYESMRLGRVPDLIQPIRDNPTSTNGRGSHSTSVANDLKPPELIKPLEEPMARHTPLTNGLETNMTVKNEIKTEYGDDLLRDSQDSGLGSSQFSKSSLEYLSPLKSAQSISALLQEPLAPMPSLLTAIPEYGQPQQQRMPSLPPQIHQDNSNHENLRSHQVTESQSERHTMNIAPTGGIKEDKELLSTVDISALSAPQQTIPEAIVVTTSSSSSLQNPPNLPAQVQSLVPTAAPSITDETTTVAPSSSSRKSEHHKSEKKKKKEKHKHKEKDKDKDKDKDKSREKRKHKHKDKDKEKEKHIKITIPKDKLNLSTEMTVVSSQQSLANPTIATSQEKKSPQATTGLKIKIPKERLKGNTETTSQQQVQAPLKIKIRTSGGNAMGEGSETSVSMSTSSSRKRDRSEALNDANSAPPSKKQHHHSQASAAVAQIGQAQQGNAASSYGQQQQIQQQQQRQNGRHYSSNNKVRGGRGAHDLATDSSIQRAPTSSSSSFASSGGEPTGGLNVQRENHARQQQQHTGVVKQRAPLELRQTGGNSGVKNAIEPTGIPSSSSTSSSSVGPTKTTITGVNAQMRNSKIDARAPTRNPPIENQAHAPTRNSKADAHAQSRNAHNEAQAHAQTRNVTAQAQQRNSMNRGLGNNRNMGRNMGEKNPYSRPPGGRGGHMNVQQDNSYFFANFPPPNMNYHPGGYSMYDHAIYYQQYQQQQFAMAAAAAAAGMAMYPTGNVIMTPDGAIDTSVPPPNLTARGVNRGGRNGAISAVGFSGNIGGKDSKENPPPLPSGPPPNATPPPPPPPPE